MIKKVVIWYLMLKKRLLKKAGFLVILCIIPMLAFLLRTFVEKEDSGLIRVAMAAENPEDELTIELMEKACEENHIFTFRICDTPQEAKRCVENASVDVAWIFENNMQEQIQKAAEGKKVSLLTVYEVEENTFLKISREKLFGVLYPYIAYYTYENYVTEDMRLDDLVHAEELKETFEAYIADDKFIDFEFLDSSQKNLSESHFLTSPIRGLLMIVMLLSGMASTMYFLQDEKKGTFSWLSREKRFCVFLGSNFAALSLAGFFVTAALIFSNSYTSIVSETISMLLFILMASIFCTILGAVFRSVKSMCIMLPTIMVAAVAFCPVFFNTHIAFQQVLPPYYYLYSINDVSFWWLMALYCIIACPIGYVLYVRKYN